MAGAPSTHELEDALLNVSADELPGASGRENNAMFSIDSGPTDDYEELFENMNVSLEDGSPEAAQPTEAALDGLGLEPPMPQLSEEPEPVAEEPSKPSTAAAAAQQQAVAEDPDDELPDWTGYDKHVFILSLAGKPIYSRHFNEDRLASIMGVMQALVSFVQDDKNQLRSFIAGRHKFFFLIKGPILLVMVSSTGESEAQMAMQLNYVYSQIIFVLTYAQLSRIFETRPNFDLRRMLSDEKFIDNLLDLMNINPSFFLSAVRCLPLKGVIRDKIGGVLQSCRHKDVVFAVLIADNQLITLLRPKKYSLHPADLHLIFNLVASTSFRSAESWLPFCLPKFNNTGFLHAHVSYIDEGCKICLLLISNNKDAFFDLSSCRSKIVQTLSSNGSLQQISNAISRKNYKIGHLGIPDLRHFVYKVKATAQFASPAMEAPYNLPAEEQRLFRRYQYVHHRIHSRTRPLKICFHVGAKETIMGLVTSGFELYAAFGPLATKNGAMQSIIRVIKWMKGEEDKLFIVNSQVF